MPTVCNSHTPQLPHNKNTNKIKECSIAVKRSPFAQITANLFIEFAEREKLHKSYEKKDSLSVEFTEILFLLIRLKLKL